MKKITNIFINGEFSSSYIELGNEKIFRLDSYGDGLTITNKYGVPFDSVVKDHLRVEFGSDREWEVQIANYESNNNISTIFIRDKTNN